MESSLFHVDEEIRKKVNAMFDKTEESALADVETIKSWLKTQPHLPEIMEDAKIRNFLILNKYRLEQTKQKIDMYYTIRTLTPSIFEQSNPKVPKMKETMDLNYCCVHPKAVDGVYRVYFFKPKKIHQGAPLEVGMQCGNIFEVRLYEDCMVGDIIVFDFSTVSLRDILKLTPSLAANLVGRYEKVFSIRVKQVYLLNSPSYVTVMLAILKAFVKPKIFSRIQVCQDESVLKTIFDQDTLPKDYGGDGPSLEELNQMLLSKLEQYQKRFDLLDELKVDESLRPKKEEKGNSGFFSFFSSR